MVFCKFFSVLLVAALLSMSSCDKADDNVPTYGKIEFDGTSFELTGAFFEMSSINTYPFLPPVPNYYWSPRHVVFAGISLNKIDHGLNCALIVNEFDVRKSITVEGDNLKGDYFICFSGTSNIDISYATNGSGNGPESRANINMNEGDETNPGNGGDGIDDLPESPCDIIAGKFSWTAGKISGKLEFDLTLRSGKRAKGSATIPYNAFGSK